MAFLTKKKIVLAVGLLVIGGGAAAYFSKNKAPVVEPPRFRTAAADTGNITQTVTATGTINPVALINIGSQVSGTVSELKADFRALSIAFAAKPFKGKIWLRAVGAGAALRGFVS